MASIEQQIEMARETGLQIVRVLATGERGWMVGGLGQGRLTIRVRIAGSPLRAKNIGIDEVEFEG